MDKYNEYYSHAVRAFEQIQNYFESIVDDDTPWISLFCEVEEESFWIYFGGKESFPREPSISLNKKFCREFPIKATADMVSFKTVVSFLEKWPTIKERAQNALEEEKKKPEYLNKLFNNFTV